MSQGEGKRALTSVPLEHPAYLQPQPRPFFGVFGFYFFIAFKFPQAVRLLIIEKPLKTLADVRVVPRKSQPVKGVESGQ